MNLSFELIIYMLYNLCQFIASKHQKQKGTFHMSKDDLFDNLSKLTTGALSSVSGAKEDIENFVKSKVERVINDLELVQKEEFEALRAMVLSQAEDIKKLKEKLGSEEATEEPHEK